MFEQAPRNLIQTEKFMKMQEAAQQLIGVGKKKRVVDATRETDARSTRETEDVAFWAETISATERLENANAKKSLYEKGIEEMPTFSIGLTQEIERPFATVSERCAEIEKVVNEDAQVEEQDEEHVVVGNVTENEKDVEVVAELQKQEVKRKGANHDLVLGEKMTYLRPRRAEKAAKVLKSSYMERVLDTNDTSNSNEKVIWKWVMQDAPDK
ncbi:unnamed protein product, partial [Cuscuta europaea]